MLPPVRIAPCASLINSYLAGLMAGLSLMRGHYPDVTSVEFANTANAVGRLQLFRSGDVSKGYCILKWNI